MRAVTRALVYSRVSTPEQDYSRQESELLDVAARSGWQAAVLPGSHTSGLANDSDLNRIMEMASRREFDLLMVWELSRLSRKGPGAVLSLLQRLESCGVRVWSLQESWLNVDGPQRELLIAIFAWVANWERKMISERTKSQMARLKALGVHVGRPKGTKDRKPRTRRWAKAPTTEPF
jgi:DNA invertase Pin-like site-specific DNA recombinase